MRLIPETHIDFAGKRGLFFGLTGVLLLISIGSLVFRGFKYGVDFTGGSLLQIRFEKRVSVEAMRSALSAVGEGGATIQQDERGDFFVRVKPKDFGGQETFSSVLGRQLSAAFSDNPFEVLREETVGPQVSRELQGKVLLALAIGLIGILIYVSFRFNFQFGVAAVMSLVFVTVIELCFLSLTGMEITMTVIAALLTVIGYAVNDSIVVSDRIREDVRKIRKETFLQIVNRALNETLSRTVITGLSVFFVLIALLLLGAASIRDFAAIMLVGMVMGTYSSIFVVANAVVEWEQKFPSKRRR
ncbi:protein translocase subunit SecF [candidate division WOR-3 bacterium]|uniref:Protein-export membrane protein SecF n=1 Tax=candidate division WOR-3 bacterium TaxID=2052148 RepID=A0A937XFR8_UNCW3|nr:protein translocase subunit SecF [candidate division WOR-3 bacterium]